MCISQLPITVTTSLRGTWRKKGFTWLTTFEVSVYPLLGLLGFSWVIKLTAKAHCRDVLLLSPAPLTLSVSKVLEAHTRPKVTMTDSGLRSERQYYNSNTAIPSYTENGTNPSPAFTFSSPNPGVHNPTSLSPSPPGTLPSHLSR